MLCVIIKLTVVEEQKWLDCLNKCPSLDGAVITKVEELAVLVEQLQLHAIHSIRFYLELANVLLHQVEQLDVEVWNVLTIFTIERIVLTLNEKIGW